MPDTNTTPPLASPPDPPKDPPATTAPTNLEVILHVVGILLTYGRHLIDTVSQRATAPNFSAIAANFGTANLSTIIAHLNRGILRCMALERILLARAATGKDIDVIDRHTWTTPEPDPAPPSTEPEPPAAAAATELPAATGKRTTRPSRPAGWDDPNLYMPTLEDLERQMRNRPIGRIIYDIALDLAVVPGLCHPAFWGTLADIMHCFSRGHVIAKLMQEKTRRRAAFDKEQDHSPNANWDWINMPRDTLRQVLGFFIGEPPVNPLDPAAAIATAPP
jgi:hypothetical protein